MYAKGKLIENADKRVTKQIIDDKYDFEKSFMGLIEKKLIRTKNIGIQTDYHRYENK